MTRKIQYYLLCLIVCLLLPVACLGQVYVPSQVSDIQGLTNALGGGYYDAKYQYGAKGDGIVGTNDGTITSGTNVFSSASASFTGADVGKLISIAGAGSAGGYYVGTITGYTNTTTVTLSSNAGTSVTTARYIYGSDDTTAIQNAVNAAATAGGGGVFLRQGRYCTSVAIQWRSQVSLIGSGTGSCIITPINLGSGANSGAIRCDATSTYPSTASNPAIDCTFRDFQIDGTWMNGAWNVYLKAINLQYSLRTIIYNLYVQNTPATSIATDFAADSFVAFCKIVRGGRLKGSNTAGSSGIGQGTGAQIQYSYNFTSASMYDTGIIMGCQAYNCGNFGIFIEYQSAQGGGWVIVGNKCEGNTKGGIGIAGADRGTQVIGNTCVNNVGPGIYIGPDTLTANGSDAPTQWIAANNKLWGNGTAQVLVDYRQVTASNANVANCRGLITGNLIANQSVSLNSDANGILIYPSPTYGLSNLDITNNTIYWQKRHGIALAGSGKIDRLGIRNNKIFSNSAGATSVKGTTSTASTTVTSMTAADVASCAVGQQVFGSAISAGTTVSAVGTNTITLSTNPATSASNATFYVVNRGLYDAVNIGGSVALTNFRMMNNELFDNNLIYANATSSSGATTLNIASLSQWIPVGATLTFASGSTATLSSNSGNPIASGVTTLPVNALGATISAGDTANYQTQRYAIRIESGATISSGRISLNDLSSGLTGVFSNAGTLGGTVRVTENDGYNPLGISTISVGASPYTYTAGNSPEMVYISGGTISSVVKGGLTLAAGIGTVVRLGVGESITITYSVAPTMVTDKQ